MSKQRIRKPLRDILKRLGKDEWTMEYTGQAHIRFRHIRTGVSVFTANTPSDGRALMNCVKRANRLVAEADKK